jgi:hypothetical protein
MTHGGLRTEWLWCNFPEPIALHDYRYLGIGFRKRERIKHKKQRWTARLHSLPMLERQALLAAIDEAWRILSPEITMLPTVSPFSPMPGPASSEVARAESSIAGNDDVGRHRRH